MRTTHFGTTIIMIIGDIEATAIMDTIMDGGEDRFAPAGDIITRLHGTGEDIMTILTPTTIITQIMDITDIMITTIVHIELIVEACSAPEKVVL